MGLAAEALVTTGAAQSRCYEFDATGGASALRGRNGSGLSRGAYTAWGSTFGYSPGTPFGWMGEWGCYTDSESGGKLLHVYGQYIVGKVSGADLAKAAVNCAGSVANAAMMVCGMGDAEEAGEPGVERVEYLKSMPGLSPERNLVEQSESARSLKDLASEVRISGLDWRAVKKRTIAVCEDSEARLFAGSSSGFDSGQRPGRPR